MLRQVAARQRRGVASPRQDFIPHEVESDYLGRFHSFIKVAIDGVSYHRSQLFECVALGMDAISQCGGCITAVHFVFASSKMISLIGIVYEVGSVVASCPERVAPGAPRIAFAASCATRRRTSQHHQRNLLPDHLAISSSIRRPRGDTAWSGMVSLVSWRADTFWSDR